MAFSDDFNRADESLEVSSNWTRIDGSAGAAAIVSNVLKCNDGSGSGSLYVCPDQGSANHATTVDINTTSNAFHAAARATDNNNNLASRHASGQFQAYKRVASTFTLLGAYTAALVSGDTVELSADSADDIRLKVNTVLRVGPVNDSFNNTETRQGVLPRGQITNNWLDNFSAAPLAAPSAAISNLVSSGGLAGGGSLIVGPGGLVG